MESGKNGKSEGEENSEAELPSYAKQVGNRIALIADDVGRAKLCELVGIGQTTLYRYTNGVSVPPLDVAALIAIEGEKSLQWLAFGETGADMGEAMSALGSISRGSTSLYAQNPHVTVLTTDGAPLRHFAGSSADLVEVPLYRNLLSAGLGIPVVDDEIIGTRSFNKEWIENELGVPLTMLALAIVRGDSMIPTLHSGDIVLIDKRDTGPTTDDIYAILLDGEVYAKRLQRGLDGTLTVISDNPRYPPQALTADGMNQREFGILGRVVWWGHTNAG